MPRSLAAWALFPPVASRACRIALVWSTGGVGGVFKECLLREKDDLWLMCGDVGILSRDGCGSGYLIDDVEFCISSEKQSREMVVPLHKTQARSIVCCNSLTLPGQ